MVKIIQQFRQGFNGTGDQSQERGSVVVLVALALTALLGFCAIVTDVGLLYAKKVQLQNSVNAAALAGVQELPNNLSQATQKARDYASQNGVPAVTVTFGASNAKIIVQATQQVPTYFARIWGITEKQISVSAKAMLVPPTGIKGAVPLSILDEKELKYGEPYVLKSSGGAGNIGWYYALSLGGTGASVYANNIKYGYSGTLKLGDIVDIETGVMSGKTETGVNFRLDSDKRVPPNTFDNYDWNAPQIVYVPVVKRVSSTNSKVEIVGFAVFFLDKAIKNGNDTDVYGRFIQTIASNGQNEASLSELLSTEYDMENGGARTDFGMYTTKLVKN